MRDLEQIPTKIKRVALMGPESTGKSSLSKALAKKFETVYVEEYMRTYLEKKWEDKATLCEEIDIQKIVEGQIKLENEAIPKANQLIFCDTNAIQNLIYAEEYYPGFKNATVSFCANNHNYDIYLLCNIDVPWENDILRDKPKEREKMFTIFNDTLCKRNIKFTVVSGSLNDRVEQTSSLIQKLLES